MAENAHSRLKSADTSAMDGMAQDASAMMALRPATSADMAETRLKISAACSTSVDDPFLSSFLRVQRAEWAEQYVDFALLMSQVRLMERRLVEIRRAGRHSKRSRHHGRRHRSVGNELEALAKSDGEQQPISNISPRHSHHRSEGFLPALAAAPEDLEVDDRFIPLSPTKRAISLFTGIGGGGRNPSDSSVSVTSST